MAHPKRTVPSGRRRQRALLALAHRVACLLGLAGVAWAGQPSEGRQPAEGSPQGMQSIGNTAAGIAAALTPWPSQKSISSAAFSNFSQVLKVPPAEEVFKFTAELRRTFIANLGCPGNALRGRLVSLVLRVTHALDVLNR